MLHLLKLGNESMSLPEVSTVILAIGSTALQSSNLSNIWDLGSCSLRLTLSQTTSKLAAVSPLSLATAGISLSQYHVGWVIFGSPQAPTDVLTASMNNVFRLVWLGREHFFDIRCFSFCSLHFL